MRRGNAANRAWKCNYVKFPAFSSFLHVRILPSGLSYVTYIGVMCYEASCTLSSQHTRSPPPLSSEPTCQLGAIPGHLAAFAPAEPWSTSAPRGEGGPSWPSMISGSPAGADNPAEKGVTLLPDNNSVSAKSFRLWQEDPSYLRGRMCQRRHAGNPHRWRECGYANMRGCT